MPTYDFSCGRCGPFEAMRPIAERDRAEACPACGVLAARTLSAARLGNGADARSRLIGRQERALADGSYRRMRHAMGCGCCRR